VRARAALAAYAGFRQMWWSPVLRRASDWRWPVVRARTIQLLIAECRAAEGAAAAIRAEYNVDVATLPLDTRRPCD
jgi:hypothetical protein